MSKVTHSVFEPRFQSRFIHSKNDGSDSFQYQDICSETETQGTVGALLMVLGPSQVSGQHQLPAVRTCISLPEGFLTIYTKEVALSVFMEGQQSQEIINTGPEPTPTPPNPTFCSQTKTTGIGAQISQFPCLLGAATVGGCSSLVPTGPSGIALHLSQQEQMDHAPIIDCDLMVPDLTNKNYRIPS